ncbi:MAG: hypothetical protein KAH09_12385, partial [Desulfobacula sp.]|nr:hypothetical protein [Desulfobacula sp.]
LATHPDFRDGSQNILMHGNKIMLKYAMEYLKLDDLVITVNPKHSMVYKDVLMFDDIGDGKIKPYPKVNSHPAVALRLNLHEVEEKCRHFYGNNSLETNLHHFLFVKHSSMLELPEKNDIIDNHFARFFTPDTRTGARDILPIQPDDQRGQPIWEAVPFFGTNPVKSSEMGTAIRAFPS